MLYGDDDDDMTMFEIKTNNPKPSLLLYLVILYRVKLPNMENILIKNKIFNVLKMVSDYTTDENF